MNYESYIEQLQPKPTFNLTWYKGEDKYSDGDIENAIVGLIAGNIPEDYSQSIAKYPDWAIFYHLSHVRRNLLAWYPFKRNSNVLEIGCGFGALTRLLCEKCEKVTSVELSKRRAAGALLRCRDKENLEIIVGNLNDIDFRDKYDYITLIGVLEYQGKFTDSENPYLDFLKKIKSLLKPDGKLLIAIENQYGIKYWCGKAEDHTGVQYDSINQYPTDRGVRTFSKKRLENLIKESGFERTYFYYPQPDYKLPDAVFSQDYIPKTLAGSDVSFYYLQDPKTLIANERRLYPDLVENEVFEFFANSFLVECGNDKEAEDRVIFAKCNSPRNDDYRMITTIQKNGVVRKMPAATSGYQHLVELEEESKRLLENGVNVLGYQWSENKDSLETVYRKECLLEEVLKQYCENGEIDKVYRVYDKIYDNILRSSELSDQKGLIYDLGIVNEEDKIGFANVLRYCSIDMVPRNAFVQGEELIWFDQEWVLENVPAEFALYRAIVTFFEWNAAKGVRAEEMLLHYGIEQEKWEIYFQLNQFLYQMVMDADYQSVRIML